MNTRLNTLAIVAALVTGFAATAHAADTSAQDAALAASVKTALVQLPEFQDQTTDIIVKAHQGKVNLSGWVSYTSDVDAAEKVAAKVDGVKAVTANFRTWSSDER